VRAGPFAITFFLAPVRVKHLVSRSHADDSEGGQRGHQWCLTAHSFGQTKGKAIYDFARIDGPAFVALKDDDGKRADHHQSKHLNETVPPD
jgi:hypothetical protein